MRFFSYALGFLAARSTPQNAFISPTAGAVFTAGQSGNLEWTPTTNGTISLRLQWGSTTTAGDGVSIASAVNNTGSYSWDVPASIPKESDYFIRISDDSNDSVVDYSARFSISGAAGASSSTSSGASSTTSSSTKTKTSTSTGTITGTTTGTTTSASSSSNSTTTTSGSSTPSSSTLTTTTSRSSATTSSTSTLASATSSSQNTAAPSATTIPDNGVGAVQAPMMMMAIATVVGVLALF